MEYEEGVTGRDDKFTLYLEEGASCAAAAAECLIVLLLLRSAAAAARLRLPMKMGQ